MAVLGLYDKGKTFVLNNLTESKLPSGKKARRRHSEDAGRGEREWGGVGVGAEHGGVD